MSSITWSLVFVHCVRVGAPLFSLNVIDEVLRFSVNRQSLRVTPSQPPESNTRSWVSVVRNNKLCHRDACDLALWTEETCPSHCPVAPLSPESVPIGETRASVSGYSWYWWRQHRFDDEHTKQVRWRIDSFRTRKRAPGWHWWVERVGVSRSIFVAANKIPLRPQIHYVTWAVHSLVL